jgi:hypothetical protein
MTAPSRIVLVASLPAPLLAVSLAGQALYFVRLEQ